MRVIKYGNGIRRFVYRCSCCQSEIEYTPADIITQWQFTTIRVFVVCPVCKKEHIKEIIDANTNDVLYSGSILWKEAMNDD